MARLTLISDTVDRELDAIRRTVEVFEQVGSVEAMIANLRDHARREDQVDTLDLVGHSRGHGFLVMGRWVLDDSPQVAATFSQDLRSALDVWISAHDHIHVDISRAGQGPRRRSPRPRASLLAT